MPESIDIALKTLKDLENRAFKGIPDPIRICKELKEEFKKIKPFMPILSALKNPDFGVNHCKIVLAECGINIETYNQESD